MRLPRIIVILVFMSILGSLGLTIQAQNTKPTTQPKLSTKEDPTQIGKRNINAKQIDLYSIEKEVALGRALAAQLDKSLKFVDDPIITEYINRVGQNIVLHSDAKVPFTIKVIDSDDVNAFALPGGFFYVNKGLILAADNEAEIACVMAHEIGHVAARHAVEQASKAKIFGTLAQIGMIFVGGGVISSGADLGLSALFLNFSRGMESEADMLGIQYAWATGYDPNAMITFFEKLQRKEKNKPGTIAKIFKTHPPTPDRIKHVRELLAKFPERDEYTITTSDFNQVKKLLLAITHTRSIDSDRRDTQPKRPTLKRRHEDPNDNPQSQPEETPERKDRPTLKRKQDQDKPPEHQPAGGPSLL